MNLERASFFFLLEVKRKKKVAFLFLIQKRTAFIYNYLCLYFWNPYGNILSFVFNRHGLTLFNSPRTGFHEQKELLFLLFSEHL